MQQRFLVKSLSCPQDRNNGDVDGVQIGLLTQSQCHVRYFRGVGDLVKNGIELAITIGMTERLVF